MVHKLIKTNICLLNISLIFSVCFGQVSTVVRRSLQLINVTQYVALKRLAKACRCLKT